MTRTIALFYIALLVVLVNSWNEEKIEQTLKARFSKARYHAPNPKYKIECRNFIINSFRDYGLTVIEQPVKEKFDGVNVIGILPGQYYNTSDDKLFGIGAHYDTVNDTDGVDDNGSGVVAMLSAAESLSKFHMRNMSLIFVAFDFEESDYGANEPACPTALCGSKVFVPWLQNNLPSSTVEGFIIMDTIMNFDERNETQILPFPDNVLTAVFPEAAAHIFGDNKQGDFLTVITRLYEKQLGEAFREAFTAVGNSKFEMELLVTPIPGKILTRVQAETYADLMRSDHRHFWKNGQPAIFLTDTANFRGYMKKCYHSQCDDIAHMTQDMLTSISKTAQAMVGMVDKLSPGVPREGSVGGGVPVEAKLYLTFLCLGTLLLVHS